MTSTTPAAGGHTSDRPVTELLTEVAADELTSERFRAVGSVAFSGEPAYREFRDLLSDWEAVEKAASSKTASGVLRGYCHLLLGETEAGAEALQKQKSDPWGAYHLARALLGGGRAIEAKAIAQEGHKKHGDCVPLTCLLVEILCRLDEVEAAEKVLADATKAAPEATETLHAIGVHRERTGDYPGAIEAYRAAAEKDPENADALFRLGYLLDIHGSDADEANDAALTAYEQCVRVGPVHVNAAINLGLMYEDRERYHDAIKCYEMVLRYHPNHPRAKLYLGDAKASTTMFYDREQEKKADRQSQVLKIPVTDFELSVRSRNCLQKMEIKTLGDLIMKTEQELLSYKNFGETSLEEIKEMLTQKNLRLGQGLEDGSAEGSHGRNPLEATADQGVLEKPVEDLDLTVRSRRCMERLGVRTVRDLINKTEMELMSAKNFGMTSLNEIKRKLAELGLALRS